MALKNPWKQFSKINPQPDNHRRIASDIFQALMQTDLTGAEFRVIMAIMDKTWGFNKQSEIISIPALAAATRLAVRTVRDIIKTLKAKRIIYYEASGIGVSNGSPFNEFMANKHYDLWLTQGCPTAQGCAVAQGRGEPVRFQGCAVAQANIERTTIERTTIEKDIAISKPKSPIILKKEKKGVQVDPILHKVIIHVCEKFAQKRAAKYPFTGKHSKIIHRLCQIYRHEEIMALWDLFMIADDDFYTRCGHSIECFAQSLPKLLDSSYKQIAKKYEKLLYPDLISEESALQRIGLFVKEIPR